MVRLPIAFSTDYNYAKVIKNKLSLPKIREADPGGLGACPQKKTWSLGFQRDKQITN
jgi:hypothetical protein